MKKPSLGLLLTASDGFDKDKCYIMVPWHMSVCIVEGHSGENETANILAVFHERQTGQTGGLLFMWRPATMESRTETRSPRFRPTGSKNSPQITAIPSGTDSHRSGAKNNEESL